MFRNKVLLITGGTGSFGNAVLKRFLDTRISEVRIFSRDEKKQEDMRIALNNDRLKFYIGDVRDYDSLDSAMKGVDYVFHAAALKQVPSCEFYPMEAVRTNILGAENVLNASIANHVKKVIVLSTDKAVYPINAMGLSKAMMEKLMVAKSRTTDITRTVLCATRYGNVMASRGSVIPLFVQQIKEGKSLTLTDPNMTRFLMSLEDSVDLVLYAFAHANSGDILVQKSPASTIRDLAQALKELFSAGNEIKIIGTRHGEKLYETLVTREEMVRAEDLGTYYRIPSDSRDLNYNKYFVEGEEKISLKDDYTSHNTTRLDVEGVKELLLKLDYIRGELNA
ncbi:polysaccharide biosynthesis protein [Geobacter sulfurreducens]|uniref:UDP-glucose 4-epimerase n=1 Tax=Geobacter sulfurreducens (strain ATCC 51573 / DSM 12127 / PCA) TaxID=243231 RepID=Q74AV4_GEOSL|nr:polysaccharide biosynthesis protein [Geobacter sulfurreducens]AAR35622.1 UDP-N-acetylglucosamine 4,6-dehydratase and UDP-2-acetamido-2,6-dideoxy-alpha-D-xylo-4-hexulose 5-epimerase [Geobacter sulfurreducens PCA]ADI85003.1 UDP-N-acetylglucosamine 4,6-dehydratase and UDP-2-acetamido-2,6-dideoxy-alpha-D-xylo-4-hexulose 5-epimerase [Geobacter sulfurreducens KN400]UAC02960.1 polysaccharide biosynthesis protein [Geobacter sulfurreducens]HBB69457.1 UDP-glucose 4-epimerase [Geobacter sulfurreducens]